MQVTLNETQQLFCIKNGDHFSCMGFSVVYEHCLQLINKLNALSAKSSFKHHPELNAISISKEEQGSLKQYEDYRSLIAIAQHYKLGTWYSLRTPKKVQTILDSYMGDSRKIRVFYGDSKTGRDWLEELDTIGRIGRSTGFMQIPLIITEGEYGGPGLLDGCIVRLIDVESNKELYRHPNYHLPTLTIGECDDKSKADGFNFPVFADNVVRANFKTFGKACAYVAFITGECHCNS